MVRRPTDGSPGLLVHPLSYVRQQRDWTYQDLVEVIARRLNTAARREKAWRWEHWGVVPDHDTQHALAAELGVPAELVNSLEWPDWLPTGEHIDTDAPWTFAGSLALLHAAVGSAMLDRRGFLIMGAGTATAVAHNWLTVEPPEIASVLRGGRVGTNLVTCFEQRLPTLRRLDATLGGGHVQGLVDSELRLVTDLLTNGSLTERVNQRLLAVAAELGRIAGWASYDAGFQAAAERYWMAALHASHAAQDRGIGANILKSMSLQRSEADRPDESLALATAAREGAAGGPARVLAMLTVRQARAHAGRGEASDCERLLASAETHMSHADDEPVPPWATYFDNAEYRAQVAFSYRVLQRHRAADHWLEQALRLQPDERSRDRATYLMWRADSVFELGDVEHACALVCQAIPDIAAARSARIRRRLAGLQAKLHTQPHLSVVQEVDEQIYQLIA
jgi:hypothetical protein